MRKTLLTILAAAASLSLAAQGSTVIFEDDFSYLEEYSALYKELTGKVFHDHIGTNMYKTEGTYEDGTEFATPQINSVTLGDKSLEDVLNEKGYTFTRIDKNKAELDAGVIYAQKHYLKFGKNHHQAAISLPKLTQALPADASVTLSFDWAPMQVANEAKAYDPTAIVVVVKNGDAETQFAVPAHTIQTGEAMRWEHADIAISGVTLDPNTIVTIRPEDEQWGVTKQHRWFIDNIKITGAASSGVEGIIVDNEAPIEYFNLQGMRIAKPGTGLYIRRQGNDVKKVFLKN